MYTIRNKVLFEYLEVVTVVAEITGAKSEDLNMPVMDGWQFLDEFVLLPIKKEISVFIMTSSIDPVDIEMAKKYKIVNN